METKEYETGNVLDVMDGAETTAATLSELQQSLNDVQNNIRAGYNEAYEEIKKYVHGNDYSLNGNAQRSFINNSLMIFSMRLYKYLHFLKKGELRGEVTFMLDERYWLYRYDAKAQVLYLNLAPFQKENANDTEWKIPHQVLGGILIYLPSTINTINSRLSLKGEFSILETKLISGDVK